MRGGMEMTRSNSSGPKRGISREATFVDDCSPDGNAQVIRYICRAYAMFSHDRIPLDAGDFSSPHRRDVGWAKRTNIDDMGLIGE
jgi:hypothetical protein